MPQFIPIANYIFSACDAASQSFDVRTVPCHTPRDTTIPPQPSPQTFVLGPFPALQLRPCCAARGCHPHSVLCVCSLPVALILQQLSKPSRHVLFAVVISSSQFVVFRERRPSWSSSARTRWPPLRSASRSVVGSVLRPNRFPRRIASRPSGCRVVHCRSRVQFMMTLRATQF